MTSRKFSQRSLDSLRGVHPDLARVVATALRLSPLDFTVIEGLRTRARQAELVASGASRTMNSRHLHGLAVDLMPINPATGKGAFDWPLYHQLAPAVKAAAAAEGVPVTWGGDWTTFKDGPHFELPHALYPDGVKFTPLDPANLLVGTPADPVQAWLASAPAPIDQIRAWVDRMPEGANL